MPWLRSLPLRFSRVSAAHALRSPRRGFPRASAAHARQRLLRKTCCRPTRLTLGVAAATVVTAMTAITVAMASGGGSAAARASDAAAIGHAARAGVTGQAQVARQAATARPAQPARPASPARQASPPPSAQPAPPPQPYLIYDSLTPAAIPPGVVVATYATGPLAPSPTEVTGRSNVLWIDTTGTDYAAPALDVEPGNVGPSQAATWAYGRLSRYPNAYADVYTFLAEWPACQQAIGTLPAWMQARVHWWIADPTGVPHMVPGSWATQWYWGPNYDISTATSGY
jgi:hypothetical protein